MECNFCKRKFSSKSILKYHQKTAKYCLKIQGKESMLFNCNYCGKVLSTKQHLIEHHSVCNEKMITDSNSKHKMLLDNTVDKYEDKLKEKDLTIKELKKQIRELHDKLENVAIKVGSRATTTTNTQINNYIQKLELTTDEYMDQSVSNLTIEHIKRGPTGYAEYALEYPLNNRLVCVDYSRRKVKYKDKEGNVITDPEMAKLTKKLFESINSRNKELIMEFLKDTSGKLDPVVQMEMMADMGDYIAMVNRGAAGEKTDLYHDFVKMICSKTIKD